MEKHPIENIVWKAADELTANDYNPNVVYNKELGLLKLSLLKQGWIQPVLATSTGIIIDGFHRWSLTKSDGEVAAMTGGKVPCAILELTEPERMLLTVRINRAKGSHIACKMHEMVKALVEKHGLRPEEIAKEIGGTKDEIEVLLMENVFKKLDIERHKYSQAWYPQDK